MKYMLLIEGVRLVVLRRDRAELPPGGLRVAGHHRLDAVRAHLLEMAGDDRAAIAHYRTAASRTASIPEQRYLITRAASLRARRRA
jgi:predicted RNA polymerase sigma factor